MTQDQVAAGSFFVLPIRVRGVAFSGDPRKFGGARGHRERASEELAARSSRLAPNGAIPPALAGAQALACASELAVPLRDAASLLS